MRTFGDPILHALPFDARVFGFRVIRTQNLQMFFLGSVLLFGYDDAIGRIVFAAYALETDDKHGYYV